MVSHLVPCPGCERHVRASEAVCPFCSATLSEEFRGQQASQIPSGRLGRAALAAFRTTVSAGAVAASAAVGASALGCAADADSGVPNAQQSAAGSTSGGSSNGGGGESNNGGSSTGSGGATSAGGDSASGGADPGEGGMPNIVPPYGIAPIPEEDAGTSEDAGTGVDDPGGQIPIYGAPPAVPS